MIDFVNKNIVGSKEFIETIKKRQNVEHVIILDDRKDKRKKGSDWLIKEEDMDEKFREFCNKYKLEFMIKI